VQRVVKVAQRKRRAARSLAVDDDLYGNTTKSLPESFNSLTVGVELLLDLYNNPVVESLN